MVIEYSGAVKFNAGQILRTDGTKVFLEQLVHDACNDWLIAPVVVAVNAVHNHWYISE